MEPSEIIKVTDTVVTCDGGDGSLGHPRVFLHIGHDGQVECPYCDRLYVLDQKAAGKAASHH